MFHQLAERLRGTIADAWARGIRFEKVDVAAYERLFVQAGFPFPRELRDELELRGAFDVPALDDDEAQDVLADQRGEGWAGRALLSKGLRLLTPSELFQSYAAQRAGALADERLGSLWVFASPLRSLWTDAFALDASGGVRSFHEDAIGEDLDLGLTAQSFEAWERDVTDEVVAAVQALTAEGAKPFGAAVNEQTPFKLDEYVSSGKKPWNTWVERIWRQALRVGSPEIARQVISDVGTLITRPSEADYRLPSALDLMHRLPPDLRREAVIEMWGSARPENQTLRAALDAPPDLRSLVPIAWPHRGRADSDDVRWARALLWLLGDPEPEQLIEAARRGVNSRDVNETLWLRLEPFAKKHGVI